MPVVGGTYIQSNSISILTKAVWHCCGESRRRESLDRNPSVASLLQTFTSVFNRIHSH